MAYCGQRNIKNCIAVRYSDIRRGSYRCARGHQKRSGQRAGS